MQSFAQACSFSIATLQWHTPVPGLGPELCHDSPARSEPSSPPPGSPQRAGGHPAIAPGADHHVRSRRGLHDKFCAVGAKLRAVRLAKSPRVEWVGSQKFDSCSLPSLGQLPMRADERNRSVRSLQPLGSLKATSVHRTQHRVAKHDRFAVAPSQDHRQVHPAVRGLRQSLILLH